jgi:hypothetical protein
MPAGIELLKKMWKRFHSFALKYEAAPALVEFLTGQERTD